MSRIAITGFGLVSALGHAALPSAAAVRATLARFTETDEQLVAADRDGLSRRPAVVARAPRVAPELCGAERASALLCPAVVECIERGRLDSWASARLRWGLESYLEPAVLRADRPELATLVRARVPDVPRAARVEEVAAPLPKAADRRPAALRHCSLLDAMIEAATAMRAGQADGAVLGVVDSLSTRPALASLASAGCLKDAQHPDGIIAGEAAGCVLLETERQARQRGATVYAYLSGWGRATEPRPWTVAPRSRAEGLTTAFREALGGGEAGLVVADLNGQAHRAIEWALARGRVLPGAALWHPADRLGDCGQAAGAVLLVVGAVALAKGYARTGRIALMATDDDGQRTVLCLERGDRAPESMYEAG